MSPSPFTLQQRMVIVAPDITFIGVDSKNRPVVASEGLWDSPRRYWAILQNGDPADITLPIKPCATPVAKPVPKCIECLDYPRRLNNDGTYDSLCQWCIEALWPDSNPSTPA
jgi:hypothetical protein